MPHDDIKLIVRAQSGDARAFAEILQTLAPQLLRYIRRLAGDRPAVDDILQESLLRIWRGLPWLDEPTVFRAWTYRIATRETYRAMKREHTLEETRADASELDGLQAPFDDPAARIDLDRMLARISPLARTVLAAHYFEGLTLEETAAVTEAPVGTVKSRLASGLKQARTLLGASP